MISTPLSEFVKNRRPFALPALPAKPQHVCRAAENIRLRWPGLEAERTTEDAEALASEMDRRRKADDWKGFYWADATDAARAFFGSDLWRKERFAPLFDLLLDQIDPGGNRVYTRQMFRTYLDTFDQRSELTRCLAERLTRVFEDGTLRMADLPIGPLVHHLHVFDVDYAPQAIAAYMDTLVPPFRALQDVGLEAPHGEGLMQQAHRLFVQALAPRIETGDSAAADRLLDWLNPPEAEKPLGKGAGDALNALLLPWHTRDPDEQLKSMIKSRLVDAYGDPRTETTGAWAACSGDARRVVLKWLVGATIRVFFDIVTRADRTHMWTNRKRLWIDLDEEDRIKEAWFALSRAGANIARDLARKRDDPSLKKFSQNDSRNASDRNKCLLIMKIDGRWVVEGSHNFKTHIFSRIDQLSVTPYEPSYTCEQFREIRGKNEPKRFGHWSISAWRDNVLMALQE